MRQKFFLAILIAIAFSISGAGGALAQTAYNASGANGGSIIPGYDSRTCDGTSEGAIRYNSSTSCAEFCDSTAWVCPGCTAPSSCTNVGDVCDDGSQFAGFLVYNNATCEPLFVTDNNQSSSSQWKTSTGIIDIPLHDDVDGKINAADRGGVITDFPAFDLCESNTYHGKSDWYLPARRELDTLWINGIAIDANAAGNFIFGDYWSSTELDASGAWFQHLGYGYDNAALKSDFGGAVRCVRRD